MVLLTEYLERNRNDVCLKNVFKRSTRLHLIINIYSLKVMSVF